MEVNRYPNNPILKPNPQNNWENFATFNGCPIKVGNKYYLVYRAMGEEKQIADQKLRPSIIGIAESDDGLNFSNRRPLIIPDTDFDKFGCEDPRITYLEGKFYIFYTALSSYPPAPPYLGVRTALAISSDLINIESKKIITPFNSKATTLFPEKINGKYTVIVSVDPDFQKAIIAIAQFDRLEDMGNEFYWTEWYKNLKSHTLPLKRMNHDEAEVGAVPVKFDDHWLLIYSYIKNRWIEKPEFQIEAVLLSSTNPAKYIARLEEPLLVPSTVYEREGIVKDVVFPSGAIVRDEEIFIYYGAADTNCSVATIKADEIRKKLRHHANPIPKFSRYDGPIIKPISTHPWEAKATFNPAAFDDGNKIHILYRAMSFDNTSVIGHADSEDGLNISERDEEPIYMPKIDAESKKIPFGNSGVEDPRVTLIDKTIYMTYTAYDGVNPPRVALTSIGLDDFNNHRWKWKTPVLISKPGIDDKDACILPEKIDNMYVIFHRIGRNIVFDYSPTMDLDGETFFEGTHQIMIREKLWDGERIGICSSPLKTKHGWLLLYHGISSTDREYRVGAMLLHPNHPSIVLARTPYPLLEPEMLYERFGHVNNVVFPCGSVVRGDTIYTYYGGGDQVCAVATISLNVLLTYLEELKDPISKSPVY